MSPFRQVQRVKLKATSPVQVDLDLDASVSETHRSTVELAKHPLEVGADVTDHIRVLGQGLELVGVVSNRPIVAEGQPILPARAGGDPASRAEEAYAALKDAQAEGCLFEILTSLQKYTGMVLVGLSCVRDAERGNIAEMQMSWEELQFAETVREAAPKPKNSSFGNRADLGKQGTKTAEEPVKASVAFKAGAALFGG